MIPLVPVIPDYDDADAAANPHGWATPACGMGERDGWSFHPRGSEATCGIWRGTANGRQRHHRAGEPPCGSCVTGASNSLAARPARDPADRMAGCFDIIDGFG